MDCGYKNVLTEMASIGKDLGREDVLHCFSEQVLRVFVTEQGESPSPSKLFARLQSSIDARAEIHELESEMDKDHFVELVTSGCFMAGGVEKLTRFRVVWHRNGKLYRNAWGYVYGSPRGKAFIRAVLYFIETAIHQTAAILDSNHSALPVAVYVDETERRFLDFNVRHVAKIATLMESICILKCKRFVIIGANRYSAMFVETFMKAFKKFDLGQEVEFADDDDLDNLIEDTGDIPYHFFDDGMGKPYLSTDRRNVWCYERCLSDENRITQMDLYNAEPWPYDEVDYTTLGRGALPQDRGAELETIEEDGDENEW